MGQDENRVVDGASAVADSVDHYDGGGMGRMDTLAWEEIKGHVADYCAEQGITVGEEFADLYARLEEERANDRDSN